MQSKKEKKEEKENGKKKRNRKGESGKERKKERGMSFPSFFSSISRFFLISVLPYCDARTLRKEEVSTEITSEQISLADHLMAREVL